MLARQIQKIKGKESLGKFSTEATFTMYEKAVSSVMYSFEHRSVYKATRKGLDWSRGTDYKRPRF